MSQTDAVCGMQVDERRAGRTRLSFAGREFYFCSLGCRNAFESDPYLYASPFDLSKSSPPPPGAPQR